MSEIMIHRCSGGHEFFYDHARCPQCGAALAASQSIDATAFLVADTTVHVNPTGKPFRLGLARLPSGAATLCRIASADILAGDTVILKSIDGIYHAQPARCNDGD